MKSLVTQNVMYASLCHRTSGAFQGGYSAMFIASRRVLLGAKGLGSLREHCIDLHHSISMEHLQMLLDLGNRESLSWILCKHTYTQLQEVTRSHVNEL